MIFIMIVLIGDAESICDMKESTPTRLLSLADNAQ